MATKSRNNSIRKALEPIEESILSDYYFSLQRGLSYTDKLKLLWKYGCFRALPQTSETTAEVTFVLYSKACERMLIPLALNLLQRSEIQEKGIKVNIIVVSGIHQLKLNSSNVDKLAALGCAIETDYFSLIRACIQPLNKLVVLCLDHRHYYTYHRWGVDAVDTLRKFSVRTMSIQHGGTREDSVEGLASTASDTILVWGERVFRELVDQYGVDRNRLRVVGNPLHDPLTSLNQEQILEKLVKRYPNVQEQLGHKKIVLLATCLHSEYKGLGDEQSLYEEYMRHIYDSLDFSEVLLLVKMHPLDKQSPNLYEQAILEGDLKSSIVVVEPGAFELNIYSLLLISELLITRASTVAEEALMMGKKVVSFDLLPEGPSKGYKHLEEYGTYTTTYATPKTDLRDAIAQALSSSNPTPNPKDSLDHQPNIEADITYRLDGNSARRATDEILAQLFDQPLEVAPLVTAQ